MQTWKIASRILSLAIFVVLSQALSGCGQFFPPETSSGGGGGGTGSNADIYVGNNNTANIAGFSIASTGINTLANSPYSLGVSPSALAITPTNSFLYVSSLAGGIFAYSIGTGGALTIANNGSAVVSGISPTALRVDSTGQWLIVVDPTPAAYVFAINTSTGTLTSAGTVPLGTGSPNHMTIAPNNSLVYVSLGTGGVAILTFNATTGVLTNTNQVLAPKQTLNAAQGLTVDPTGTYLFVAETGTSIVRVLTIATTGALKELTGSPYSTGTGPTGVLIDSTGSYLYVTNRASNNISAFLLSSSGALTQISGSPFATGINPIDLAEENTHTYVAVVCAGGTPDLQVFKIDTTTPGALDPFKTSTTGTDPTNPLAIVAAN
ncbi:MAG: beta-propeller fold lactonase family protein [Silvibacterium sp.]